MCYMWILAEISVLLSARGSMCKQVAQTSWFPRIALGHSGPKANELPVCSFS